MASRMGTAVSTGSRVGTVRSTTSGLKSSIIHVAADRCTASISTRPHAPARRLLWPTPTRLESQGQAAASVLVVGPARRRSPPSYHREPRPLHRRPRPEAEPRLSYPARKTRPQDEFHVHGLCWWGFFPFWLKKNKNIAGSQVYKTGNIR